MPHIDKREYNKQHQLRSYVETHEFEGYNAKHYELLCDMVNRMNIEFPALGMEVCYDKREDVYVLRHQYEGIHEDDALAMAMGNEMMSLTKNYGLTKYYIDRKWEED